MADGLKRLSFECGGKAANIIFEDAEVEHALPVTLHASFRSTGQTCTLASRLFVHRSLYDSFTDALVEKVRHLRVGDPLDPRTHLGPHTSREQLDKTLRYIDIGRADGAELIAGGGRPESLDRGYFVEPTIFRNVDNRSRLAQNEVFGPVLSIIPFDTEDEVVAMANDVVYGLVAGVWTSNVRRAHRVAVAIECGLVAVNTYRPVHWTLPYGGYKLSGIGRENGMEALREYTEVKTVVIDLAEEVQNPFGL